MSEPTTCIKILQPQTRVCGAVGDFIKDSSKWQSQRQLHSVALKATNCNRYMVSFDAAPMPLVLEVASISLRVEHAAVALPPKVPIPLLTSIPVYLQENSQDENILDQEEEEHLPEYTPESGDEEDEQTGRNKEDGDTES
jgi:hypothetical protein